MDQEDAGVQEAAGSATGYSPVTNPFCHRPTSRTPVGIQLAASAGQAEMLPSPNGHYLDHLMDRAMSRPAAVLAKASAEPAAQTAGTQAPIPATSPRGLEAATAKQAALKSPAVASAKRWLLGQVNSAAGAKVAAARIPAGSATTAVVPAVPTSSAGASGTGRSLQLTPGTAASGGSASSPASPWPHSFPVPLDVDTTTLAATTPEGGLASWLCMSSHLSKPAIRPHEQQLASPPGSSNSDGSPKALTQLDFAAVVAPNAEAEELLPQHATVPVSAQTAATSHASNRSALAPRQAAGPELWPTPPPSRALGSCKPATATAGTALSISDRSRSSLLRILLSLCLLAGLLMGTPVALNAMAPFAQRYLPPDALVLLKGHLCQATAHTHHLGSSAAQQANLFCKARQQAWHMYQQQLAAALDLLAVVQGTVKARAGTPAPASQQATNPVLKAAAAWPAQPPKKLTRKVQPAAAPVPLSLQHPASRLSAPASSPSKHQAAAISHAPASSAVHQPPAQPTIVRKLTAALVSTPVPPDSTRATPPTTAPPSNPGGASSMRLDAGWQQLWARLPFVAVQPPAAVEIPGGGGLASSSAVVVAAVDANVPHYMVAPPTLLAVAAVATLAAGVGLASLLLHTPHGRTGGDERAEAAEEEVVLYPSTTPAVGGRARRRQHKSRTVVAEDDSDGPPSVVAPRKRCQSTRTAIAAGPTPRTATRTSCHPSVEAELAPPPTMVPTRRRSARVAA